MSNAIPIRAKARRRKKPPISVVEPPPLTRRTYTIEEVAALFGLSRNSAYVAAREDRLPVAVIKIGKRMMVSRAALDRFLDQMDVE